MRWNLIKNQKGGVIDKLFLVAVIALAVWTFNQFRSHPDGVTSRTVDHSAYEDKPK